MAQRARGNPLRTQSSRRHDFQKQLLIVAACLFLSYEDVNEMLLSEQKKVTRRLISLSRSCLKTTASVSLLAPVPVVGSDWFSSCCASRYATVEGGLFKIPKQMGFEKVISRNNVFTASRVPDGYMALGGAGFVHHAFCTTSLPPCISL